MPNDLSWRDLQLLNLVLPAVESLLEIRRRYLQGPMTPDLVYELVYNAYGDPQRALAAKTSMMLAQMPEIRKG